MLDSTTGWWDMYCTNKYPFTCFDDRYTGNSRYIVINSKVSWYDARSYCRQYHTDLASARNSTENSIILQLIKGPIGLCWIGLHREPWKWSDKTNISAMPWIPKKPDNALGNQTCGYIYNGETGDAQCSEIMPFYCQKDVYSKKQQTIKVKVQSNQDVNEPVVKEAILEQIKQKVQEYGMADNTTFHWREQPDGDVFQKKIE
ncbi:C-type lectin BfL-1-like [Clarias gariepinus]|uniref:C-type lectin BfL-1-like n=1 Tax=Clarias gariepinus TaxID=13013 RepID=UPI00234C9ACE|nr:C-type lectin BfL-1-like [Clarias gariepinus]